MKEAAIKEFGRIDILLNNAAGNFISPTERLRILLLILF
jgi:NAD(P)-dependent dehydrogenase (short-subunit alcohol dehydrogenase family)